MTVKSKADLLTDLADNTTGNIVAATTRNMIDTTLPTEVILSDADQTLNLDLNPNSRVTITAHRAFTITGLHEGGSALLKIYQGGAGSFVPTFSGVTLVNFPVWRTSGTIPNFVQFNRSNGITFYSVS